MADADKILQALERLEIGQQAMREDIKSLKEGQKVLEEGQKTTDLKVEAFHSEQKHAHDEIINILHEVIEVNANDTDKRFDRIEKHLNLPSIK